MSVYAIAGAEVAAMITLWARVVFGLLDVEEMRWCMVTDLFIYATILAVMAWWWV